MSDEIQYNTVQYNIQYRRLKDDERAGYNEHVFKYATHFSEDGINFEAICVTRIAMPSGKETYKNAFVLISLWNVDPKYKYVLL